jgi:cytochrome c-type biogenesis protein CcmH
MTFIVRYFIQFLLLLTFINPVDAESIEVSSFSNTQQERRYRALIDEIRCPVCQGQSIGGSNAGLAKDLREKVRVLILSNKTNGDIRDFMVARYGDFVVFKPPVNKSTYLLWFLPFVFLIFALFFLIRSFSRKQKSVDIDISKAKDLLK